jgi:hypothetical protein
VVGRGFTQPMSVLNTLGVFTPLSRTRPRVEGGVGGQQWTRRIVWTRLFISTQPRWPGGEDDAGGGERRRRRFRRGGLPRTIPRQGSASTTCAGTSAPSASTPHSTTTTVSLGFHCPRSPIICISFFNHFSTRPGR